jgi:hypothetical protein
MPIKDTFKRDARWDSVGLDGSSCRHFRGPSARPDTNRVSRCVLHAVSLAIELAPSGYTEMEWFCRDFAGNGRAFPPAVAHLETLRQQLEPRVLYRFDGGDDYLVEHRMEQLDAPHDLA